MADPYIPQHEPFHIEADGFRVWLLANDHFWVCNDRNGQTYQGDLAGVVRFIERERRVK